MSKNYLGYIIVDIDGTLANISHRRKYVEQKPKDWDKFFAGIKDDTPNKWCVEIINRFSRTQGSYGIILCTGRMEKHLPETKKWLAKLNIPFDTEIFSRKDGDFRPDDVVKEEIYLNRIKPEFDPILFVIDDRKRVVDMWRRNGLVCLQCDEGNF